MPRWLAAILAALFIVGCAHTVPVNAPRQRAEHIAERTVTVDVTCVDSEGWGSAVRLGHADGGTLWATAEHVVTNELCAYSISDVGAWVLTRDKQRDVALIWTPGSSTADRYVRDLDYSDPYIGMDVWAAGFPRQPWSRERAFQITRGVLVTVEHGFFRVSSSFSGGSSGGPVFDSRGRLVGIVSRHLVTPFNTPIDDGYYVVPVSAVKRLTKNFTMPELACKCGAPVPEKFYPNAFEIARRAQALREVAGPLVVSSGYRTPAHNRRVKGVPRSKHLTAAALDLRSATHSPAELAQLYEQLIDQGRVPDGGLGVYDGHIHIDTGKPRRWRD